MRLSMHSETHHPLESLIVIIPPVTIFPVRNLRCVNRERYGSISKFSHVIVAETNQLSSGKFHRKLLGAQILGIVLLSFSRDSNFPSS